MLRRRPIRLHLAQARRVFTNQICALARASFGAGFFCMRDHVAMLDGSTLTRVTAPDDFWIEDDAGEFRPNVAKYPNSVGF